MFYRIEHTTSWAMSSPAGRIHPYVPFAITQMVTRDTTTAKTLRSAQATVTRMARTALDGTHVCAVYVPAPGSVVIFSRTKDGVHYADIFRVTDVATGEIVPLFPNVPNMPAPVWAVPTPPQSERTPAMLTVATLEPSYVATSEHFAGIRVESSDVPVTKKGDASNVWTPYRLFQTFTPDDTRRFREIAIAHGGTVRPLD